MDSVPNEIPTKKVLELINEFSKVAGYNYAPQKKKKKSESMTDVLFFQKKKNATFI